LSSCLAAIAPQNPAARLRVASAADAPFIRELFKTGRAGDFTAAGLPPGVLDALLEQQFRAQSAGYAAQFPDAVSLIILWRDEPAGRLILAISNRIWRIVDIVLIPAARGLGIGTDIIDAVARAAHEKGADELVLSVLSTNAAARRLYTKLGFAAMEGGVYIQMTKRLTS
jgi:ribosomal protein S18 acetylase RimI-like enzyme